MCVDAVKLKMKSINRYLYNQFLNKSVCIGRMIISLIYIDKSSYINV